MGKQKVVIRVDGSSKIGLGHISRCCALAEMLRPEFEIVFYTRADAPAIINDIKNYCTDVVQLSNSVDYDTEAATWVSVLNGTEIVVLDGYNFNTHYQQKVKEKGCKLICIDDIHACNFIADAVINHAPGITKEAYSVEPYTQLYLGTDYVLLKKMFLDEARLNKPLFNLENSEVLICLGGADPNNFTRQALEKATQVFKGKIINVVVGAAYMYLEELKKNIENTPHINLHVNIKPGAMLALMQQSHIAVTAASTIALEYICVKGGLFLKCIVDNQKEIYKALIEAKCAWEFDDVKPNYDLGYDNTFQYKLIDGKSNVRFLKIFRELGANSKILSFKRAALKDVDLLFNWINDPAVRAQSLSTRAITYNEHINWFNRKVADKNCYLYIVYKNDIPAGMIRFDIDGEECTISYLVDKLHRGEGLGSSILNKGIEKFEKESNFKGVMNALVKITNVPSLKIFEKAGFEKYSREQGLINFKMVCE